MIGWNSRKYSVKYSDVVLATCRLAKLEIVLYSFYSLSTVYSGLCSSFYVIFYVNFYMFAVPKNAPARIRPVIISWN